MVHGRNAGNVLTGETAILYAERTGKPLRVSDVVEVSHVTLRKMLAAAKPDDRAAILDCTSIVVPVTSAAAG